MMFWLLLQFVVPTPHRHTVEIRGMEFHPAELTVAVGDTIVWINRDIVPHTATSAGKTEWNTGPLAQGDSGAYVARVAGAVSYVCTFHPTMRARLHVR